MSNMISYITSICNYIKILIKMLRAKKKQHFEGVTKIHL